MKIRTIMVLLFFIVNMTVSAQIYPEMIHVEGGSFTMGDEWMLGDKDEQPLHRVTLKDYKIGKTEVTVRQYRAFCNATGKSMPEEPNWGWHDNHPIVNVTWTDAVAYCDWLSEELGDLYRLPTEAEWEYAARGGNKSKGYKYSGGQIAHIVGWIKDNSNGKTNVVAQKKPNELDIYDMTGNTWEWCYDWYSPNYYSPNYPINPRGPITGSEHVLRGGGWNDTADYCRVSNRYSGIQGHHVETFGFRVVGSN
ncbi:MAG: formylglycine-generating enzyme family protein [Candidatus Cyclobacteriaceae bacterium M2_1C_046]